MTEKNEHEKTAQQREADKREAEKRDADKRAVHEHDAALDKIDRDRDKRAGHIDNQNQDPNHPANKTLSPHRDPAPRSEAEAFGMTSEEMMTEQEKDAAAGGAATDGNVPGVGPAPASEVTSGPVETVEDQGIGPRTPYPTGNPPPDTETITRSQGINKPGEPRVKAKPGETTVKEPHR